MQYTIWPGFSDNKCAHEMSVKEHFLDLEVVCLRFSLDWKLQMKHQEKLQSHLAEIKEP